MSYNLLSGSIEFIGSELGEIEDIVNTHGAQTVSGAKTFTNITASGGAIVTGGALQIATALRHYGDANTEVSFTPDVVTVNAAGSGLIQADGVQNKVTINNDEDHVDFVVNTGVGSHGLYVDGNYSTVKIGSHDPASENKNILLHISSSDFPHSASLLSVGRKNNPVLAVSGGANAADWRVVVSGTLYTNSNIESAGQITGSLGLKGEIKNLGQGLTHVSDGNDLNLTVNANSTDNNRLGLAVAANGVGLSVTGLAEEGSLNTDAVQPDWVIVADNDGAGGYTNKKQKVSVLLSDTLSTVANVGSGDGRIYKTTLNKEVKLKRIAAGSNITVTNGTDDITIASTAAGAISTYTNATDPNRIITSVSSDSVNAEANFTFDGSLLTLNGNSEITGSLALNAGMHISGSMPKLAIGSDTPAATNEGMLTIRPDDTHDRVLLMCQRTEASDTRIVLAATGSGQVIVGGAHLDGVFNVSGSGVEKLISLKAPEPGIYLSSSVDSNANARIILNASNNILLENQSANKHIVFKTNDAGTIKEGFRIDGAVPEVVVNQGSDSLIDFRVESNDNTHMIFSDGSANKVGINNSTPQLTLDVDGDVGISNHLALNGDGTTDPVTLANHAHIYAKDVASSAEVFVRDEAGNITQISPHNEEGEWQYFSRNTRTGKVVRVNMERMIRKLEQITGESFMEEWYEDPTD